MPRIELPVDEVQLYDRWFEVSMRVYAEVMRMKTRSEQLAHLEKYTCGDIVKLMLDGEDYSEAIWKHVRTPISKTVVGIDEIKENVDLERSIEENSGYNIIKVCPKDGDHQ